MGGKQRPRVGMDGRVEHGSRGALLDDPPKVHDQDAMTELADDREIVRDEEVGHAQLSLQPPEKQHDLGAKPDVQQRRGLVQDHESAGS